MNRTDGCRRARAFWNLALILEILACAALPAAEPPSKKAATPEQIDRAIEQLGDPGFGVRELASEQLWQAGQAAEPALEKALASPDPEVVRRAEELLDKFRWGIYPNTPPKTVELINRFRRAGAEEKQKICERLAADGDDVLLFQLMHWEPDDDVRQSLAQKFWEPISRTVPSLMLKGDVDTCERLLEKAVEEDKIRDYAMLLLARGRLDAGIARLRQRLDTRPAALDHKRLAYLFRAKDDLPRALEAARKASADWLITELLIQAGDWRELARHQAAALPGGAPKEPEDATRLALVAACHRLVGDTEALDRSIAAIIQIGRRNPDAAEAVAKALLVNERYDEGIDMCFPYDTQEGFELLCQQKRFREAFQRIGLDELSKSPAAWFGRRTARTDDDPRAWERYWLARRVACTLCRLGERRMAVDLVTAMTSVVMPVEQRKPWIERSAHCGCEMEIGLRERAMEHAALLLAEGHCSCSVFDCLWPGQGEIAAILWSGLRSEHVDKKELATLHVLDRLMDAKGLADTPVEELQRLVRHVEEPPGEDEDRQSASDRLLSVSSLFLNRGRRDLAVAYARKATALARFSRAFVHLGDLLTDEANWAEAALAYSNGCAKDPSNAEALYMLGRANVRLGKETEGKKQMDLALLLPLGDAFWRPPLINALRQRGLEDQALRQCRLPLRMRANLENDWLHWLANAASARGHHLEAATCWEKFGLAKLVVLRFDIGSHEYDDGQDNVPAGLRLPLLVHKARGRGLLKSGKATEAVAEFRKAQAALPGDVQFVLDVVPELERANRKADAEAIFRRTADVLEGVCRDFPRSHQHHYELARMAASLGREADKALEHARRAVELEPGKAAYLDTLAEVLFRRGDREEAIRLERRCLQLEPNNSEFRKRLERFRAR